MTAIVGCDSPRFRLNSVKSTLCVYVRACVSAHMHACVSVYVRVCVGVKYVTLANVHY